MQKQYLCIDLKSFYASVECIERGLDPLRTNLCVADSRRTEKTIVLAVSPSLKSFGIPGRPRLFELVSRVNVVNAERRRKSPGKRLTGKSVNYTELMRNPSVAVDYICAPPRMAHYMAYSAKVYSVYLKHVSPDDIIVYSVDEVFIDMTPYLRINKQSAHEFAIKIIRDVLKTTGITATAGIGTNLYLAKIAMDITAKKMPADKDGVRLAELDEMSYRRLLWNHRPLTDFWRIGRGYAKRLEAVGLMTMGDIARCSLGEDDDYYNPKLLYKIFGVNAELLIDHAWGYEPCEIRDIKSYRPETNSMSSGQVLHTPYDAAKAKTVTKEMADSLVLDLVAKGFVTDQIVLTVGYDIENIQDPKRGEAYKGEVTVDRYGRKIPKHAHGTENFTRPTSSTKEILEATSRLFDRIVNPKLLVRRINIVANRIVPEDSVPKGEPPEQLDFFTDYGEKEKNRRKKEKDLEREKKIQKAVIVIKEKHGKNAILKGMNLEDGATAKDRNAQIGGHKA